MKRYAGGNEIVRKLAAQGIFQDAKEIAVVSALLGVGQYAAGADPQEIALSALAGAGVSAVAKPIAARAGRAVGRAIDRNPPPVHPRGQQFHEGFMRAIPGSRSNMIDRRNKGELRTPAGERAADKYRVNYKDGDRTRGVMEGDLGLIARTYGDNVAQAVAQLLLPGVLPEVEATG